MRVPKTLRGNCQHCGMPMVFLPEAIGSVAKCPHCGKNTELLLAPPSEIGGLPKKTIAWTVVAILVLILGLFGALAVLKHARSVLGVPSEAPTTETAQ